jgi:predicted dehydrogenase
MSTFSVTAGPRVAVAGLGGFARHVHRVLRRLEETGCCRVVATCEPDAQRLLPEAGELNLRARGVDVFDGLEAMLDALAGGGADTVMLPTPIHLHAPMHRACVERGLPVYLEKPPTLWWQELEEMLVIEARAVRPTEVGFNFTSEPARQALRERLVAGEFGALREVSFLGLWPRPESYFQRNAWAGRIFRPGSATPLLDSCAGNAMAHFLQNLLGWAAPRATGCATVVEVRATLARAHAIEGPDTVFAEARTTEGVAVRFAATHACAPEQERNEEEVVCERARWRYVAQEDCEIQWSDGRREYADLRGQGDHFERNFRRYFAYLAGAPTAPVNSLADCRAFVATNDLLYGATPGIATLPGEHWERREIPPRGVFRVGRGLDKALESFARRGLWPDRTTLPWWRAPGRAHLVDLPWVLPKLQAVVAVAEG